MWLLAAAMVALSSCHSLEKAKKATQSTVEGITGPLIEGGYRESGPWRHADPSRATKPRGKWWQEIGHRDLDAMISLAEGQNPTLQIMLARMEQSQHIAAQAKAAQWPSLTGSGSIIRNKPASVRSDGGGFGGGVAPTTPKTLTGSASWEIDLWGRLRHTSAAALADAEAAAADVAGAKLSLQAQVAGAFVAWKTRLAEKKLLQETLDSFKQSLQLTQNRLEQGVVNRGDVAQAESQLATAQAALTETELAISVQENALAALLGQTPAQWAQRKYGAESSLPTPPRVPVTASSELLQRRPDIAAAERRLMGANHAIGAGRAAFFPAISLGASVGSRGVEEIRTVPTRFWSFGPSAAATVLDFGQRRARYQQLVAECKEAEASYRDVVLTAFREVEDALVTRRWLEQQAQSLEQATRAAKEALDIQRNAYAAGTSTFLNVIVAQNVALEAARAEITLRGRRLEATIGLIRALGGDT